ncbi:MAG: hypothetical protein E6J90_06820 [Deltaproteobacteria bacterium]|nr:MAG: hypothetical protein E6J91_12435 [Deltaproteobacteria bacterium]TMQ25010.1 MAG: hypothetical protein E6J90_06820 [Deltaproteobacteria bacterium]
MPSQRLLKMMDPLGHVATSRRVLASAAPKAVVWAATARTAAWIAAELAAAGVEPLRATSFRHVDASLRGEPRPPCALAVLEFSAMSTANIAALTTARWAGYRGSIIAIAAPGAVSRETVAIVRIDAIVSPDGREPLRDAVTRVLGAPSR